MGKFVIKVDASSLNATTQAAYAELSNPIGLWDRVSTWLAGIVKDMFAKKGGMYGRASWEDIAPSMADRIRMGTDGEAHGKYGDRMDEPLVASGTYRDSFGAITKPRPTMLIWGSTHPIAGVMPYAGVGKDENRRRYAMPDPDDTQFNDELSGPGGHVRLWIHDALERAKQAGVA